MTANELFTHIQEKRSFLCVGLDTDIKKIPEHLLSSEDPAFEFNRAIIDATAPYTVAYKPNAAFYEALGTEGWKTLFKTVDYIRKNYPDIFIIAESAMVRLVFPLLSVWLYTITPCITPVSSSLSLTRRI